MKFKKILRVALIVFVFIFVPLFVCKTFKQALDIVTFSEAYGNASASKKFIATCNSLLMDSALLEEEVEEMTQSLSLYESVCDTILGVNLDEAKDVLYPKMILSFFLLILWGFVFGRYIAPCAKCVRKIENSANNSDVVISDTESNESQEEVVEESVLK